MLYSVTNWSRPSDLSVDAVKGVVGVPTDEDAFDAQITAALDAATSHAEARLSRAIASQDLKQAHQFATVRDNRVIPIARTFMIAQSGITELKIHNTDGTEDNVLSAADDWWIWNVATQSIEIRGNYQLAQNYEDGSFFTVAFTVPAQTYPADVKQAIITLAARRFVFALENTQPDISDIEQTFNLHASPGG